VVTEFVQKYCSLDFYQIAYWNLLEIVPLLWLVRSNNHVDWTLQRYKVVRWQGFALHRPFLDVHSLLSDLPGFSELRAKGLHDEENGE